MTRPSVPRRPMTANEQRMAKALGNVVFVPGIPSKRFARIVAAIAATDAPTITEGQALALRSLVRRYRRQIPATVSALAHVA